MTTPTEAARLADQIAQWRRMVEDRLVGTSKSDGHVALDAICKITLRSAPPQNSAEAACHVCGDATPLACSDCRLNFKAIVSVCRKATCRDEHERKCWGDKP